MPTVDEMQAFLTMPIEELEQAVVDAIVAEEEIMMAMVPETVPPTPVDEFVQALSPSDVRTAVLEFIQRDFDRTIEDLRELVCVKLQYCKVKKYGGELALLMAIGWHYVALNLQAVWALPPVLAYLARKKYFDRLCGCKS